MLAEWEGGLTWHGAAQCSSRGAGGAGQAKEGCTQRSAVMPLQLHRSTQPCNHAAAAAHLGDGSPQRLGALLHVLLKGDAGGGGRLAGVGEPQHRIVPD